METENAVSEVELGVNVKENPELQILNTEITSDPNDNNEPCLICSNRTSGKQFQCFQILPGSDGNSLLNQQMWSVFVLRTLLQFPKRKCSQLMKETFGVSNPGNWFEMCDDCSEIAISAMTVYSQIATLERELTSLKKQLKDGIENSVGKGMREVDKNYVNPRERIRDHFFVEPLICSEVLESTREVKQEDEEHVIEDHSTFDGFLQNPQAWYSDEENQDFADEDDPLFIPEDYLSTLKPRSKSRSRKTKLKSRLVDTADITFGDSASPVFDAPRTEILSEGGISERAENEVEDSEADETKLPAGTEILSSATTPTVARAERKLQNRKGYTLYCELCPRGYTNLASFQRHMRDHKASSKYVCRKCNYPCSSSKARQSHQKECYKRLVEYKCNHCTIVISERKEFLRHLKTHKEVKPKSTERVILNQDYGNFKLHDSSSLNSLDMKDLSTTSSPDLKLSFPSQNYVIDSVSESEASESKVGKQKVSYAKMFRKKGVLHECHICHRRYTNSDSFVAHLGYHRKYKDHTCDKCHYPCSTAKGLEDHLKKKCEQVYRRDVIYECTFCDFTCTTKRKLHAHMYSHKTMEGRPRGNRSSRTHPSEQSRDSADRDNFEKAFKRNDTYHCHSCSLSFKGRMAFIRHRRKHDFKFKCNLCSSSFKTHALQRLHAIRFHPKHADETQAERCSEIEPEESSTKTLETKDDDTMGVKDQKESAEDDHDDLEDPESGAADKDNSESVPDGIAEKPAEPKKPKKHNKAVLLCHSCNRKFSDANYFCQHLEKHELFKDTSCPKCKYPCPSAERLAIHLKKNICEWGKTDTEYHCEQCEYTTRLKTRLKHHVMGHRREELAKRNKLKEKLKEQKNLVCDLCRRRFRTVELLMKHTENHETFKESTCSKCNYPCTSLSVLHNHMKLNCCIRRKTTAPRTSVPLPLSPERVQLVPPTLHRCGSCDYTTPYPRSLERHQRSHLIYDGSETPDGQFKCTECQQVFPKPRQLSKHKREVHGDKIGLESFACSSCPKRYSRLASLKDHEMQIHKNECRYYCEVCGYGTNHAYVLDKHSYKHKNEYPYVCDTCGTSYKYKQGLQKHQKEKHSEAAEATEGKFKCKYCFEDVSFSNKALLNIHLRNTHKDMYVHKCDECENTYMSVASLQLHKKINHTNNTAACQFCDKTFFNRVYLYSHYKISCKKKPPGFKYTVPRGKPNN